MRTLNALLIVSLIVSVAGHAYADNIIRIGVSLGLTGKYAAITRLQEEGYRLWERDVNKRGGILGKKVRLIIKDDEGDPEKSVSIYRGFFKNKEVDLVFAPYQSDIAYVATQVIEQYGYPTIVSGASDDRIWQRGFKNIFGLYSPASRYFLGFLDLAASKMLKSLAIVYSSELWSRTAAEGAAKWGKEFGLKVVYKMKYSNNNEIMEISRKLKAINPDAVVVCSYFEDSVEFVRAFKKVGFFPKALCEGIGPAMPEFYKRLGRDAEDIYGPSMWETNYRMPYPNNRQFIEDFIDYYHHEPNYHAASAYAAGILLEKAIIKAGSFNRNRLRKALSDMDTLTLIGRYHVDDTGLQLGHRPITIQWQNGKKEIVWPRAMQTTQPIIGAE